MNREEFLNLIDKYLEGKTTPGEEQVLFNYYYSFQDTKEWDENLLGDSKIVESELQARLQHTIAKKKPSTVRRIFRWQRWVAAALVVVLVAAGGYLLYTGKKSDNGKIVKNELPISSDVEAPKGSKAVISLPDGSIVSLDSITSGTLISQGNINVTKTADGKILYQASGQPQPSMQYNTLVNPRGSTVVDMTLADGTRIWLNAGSSVTYPVFFRDKERKVSVTGEAYFEVAHNAEMPFRVVKDEVEVLVLGTHFNVNTYGDEPQMKITLLSGSVKVIKGDETGLLRPGQQAQIASHNNAKGNTLRKQSGIKIIDNADISEVMAWKNGLFKFNKADIQTVMSQISHWYDVEVSYPQGVPKDVYWGGIQRTLNLSEIFKVLEESGAHFKIQERKVIVLP